MSLSRAFTYRRSAKTEEATLRRNNTTKHPFGSSLRQIKISAPVELLSTTNMLSYNAPDLYPSSDASRSSQSGDESDESSSHPSTPMTSPGNSSSGSAPTSPEPNHLSCYFGASKSIASDNDAPLIPRRSPSHTKKNSIERSASRMSAFRKGSMTTARSSINMFAATPDVVEQHPFGNELAQVSELAEDYGISKETLSVLDEEEQELVSRGLFKFHAEDYMSEIQGLALGTFGDARPAMPSMWI